MVLRAGPDFNKIIIHTRKYDQTKPNLLELTITVFFWGKHILSKIAQPRFLQRPFWKVRVHAKSLQTCPTLSGAMDSSPQAPLSMGFSRQEYWSGLPFPTPRDLLDPGTEPMSLTSTALPGGFFTTAPPGKPSGRVRNDWFLLTINLGFTKLPDGWIHLGPNPGQVCCWF